MKKLSATLLGAIALSMAISSLATPSFALGGCGGIGHRDAWGHCVFGGQNEDWCLRKTGHRATRMPNGEMRCL